MELVRVSAPEEPVVSLEDARRHMRVDTFQPEQTHPDDADITAFVQAATDEIDGRNGWLGRALVTQTWKLLLDEFPGSFRFGCNRHGRIALPLPPLQSVTSVKYIDADGVEQTLTADTDYRVVTDAEPGFVEPLYGKTWPSARDEANAVRITYVAGYGDSGDDVPALLRSYVKIAAAFRYQFRELGIAGTEVPTVKHLVAALENYRMRGVF